MGSCLVHKKGFKYLSTPFVWSKKTGMDILMKLANKTVLIKTVWLYNLIILSESLQINVSSFLTRIFTSPPSSKAKALEILK